MCCILCGQLKHCAVISILIAAVTLESGFGGVWDGWSRWEVGWQQGQKFLCLLPHEIQKHISVKQKKKKKPLRN